MLRCKEPKSFIYLNDSLNRRARYGQESHMPSVEPLGQPPQATRGEAPPLGTPGGGQKETAVRVSQAKFDFS